MEIKKFFGSDSSHAMRQVRDEIGPDAAIIACHRVEGGVELVVAVEPEMPSEHHQSAGSRRRDTGEQPQMVWSQNDELLALKQELSAVKSRLEQQVKGHSWSVAAANHPRQRLALQVLEALDIDPRLAAAIVRDIPEGESAEVQREMIRAGLRSQIRILPAPREGVTALVGPPGAGKTTTIAKIAADYVRRGRRDDIALVTTDTARIGAQEQLRMYGSIFKLQVHRANDAEEASRMLHMLGNKQFVLLDTAGVAFRDQKGLEALQGMLETLPDIDVFLTLPADRESHVLEEIVERYSSLPITGVVPTHLDECVRLGGLLSTMIKHRLPAVWCSDGPEVPADLRKADANDLISRAFRLARAFKRGAGGNTARNTGRDTRTAAGQNVNVRIQG